MKIDTVKRFLNTDTFRISDSTPAAAPLIGKEHLRDYNIFECDGGGIKGVIPAYQLWAVEFREGDNFISNNFKTFWGTSTGSIVCAMLAMGWKAFDILKMYVEIGADIFHHEASLFFRPKYSNDNAKKVFAQYMKDETFLSLWQKRGVELNLQVCNTTDGTQETWNYLTQPNRLIRDGVLCSVSAPTFFPEVPLDGKVYVDGGSGVLNCTLMKAFNDAFYVKHIPAEDFFIFSLGCGRGSPKYGTDNLGKLLWIVYFGREQSITQQEKDFGYRQSDMGARGVRWNIDLSKHLNEMDNTEHIPTLISAVDK